MVLYNTSGNPHPLEGVSKVVTIVAGAPAQWVYFPIDGGVFHFEGGDYLIGIQSGATGGVVRDYGDDLGPGEFWENFPMAFAGNRRHDRCRVGPHGSD